MSRGWLHYLEVTVCILILISLYFFLTKKISYSEREIIDTEKFREYLDNCNDSPYPIKIFYLNSGTNKTCGNTYLKKTKVVYLYSGNKTYNPAVMIVYER